MARDFVAANEARLRLTRLSGYGPELNPDELLNKDMKINGLGKSRPGNRAELMAGLKGDCGRSLHLRCLRA